MPAQSSRYWVIAFESAVDVGDYTDAFSSIMAMNDKEILKDSIQQLGMVWYGMVSICDLYIDKITFKVHYISIGIYFIDVIIQRTKSLTHSLTVIVLCDAGQYQLVCELPYFTHYDYIDSVLRSKAESEDVIARALNDTITYYEVCLHEFYVLI